VTDLRRYGHEVLQLPGYATQNPADVRFAFRRIREAFPGVPDPDDIDNVTTLSHESVTIRRANPALTKERRRDLYTRWYTANPNCFLLLERIGRGGDVLTIADTAILPLKQAAYERIRYGTMSALNLDLADIPRASEPFDLLLLDTWVVSQRYMGKPRHRGYVYAMLFKHLSLFLGANAPKSVMLVVEPDSPVVKDIARWFDFYEIPKAEGTGFGIWELRYPDGVAPMKKPIIEQVLRNISTCASWPP
jgi:hypothetical protein